MYKLLVCSIALIAFFFIFKSHFGRTSYEGDFKNSLFDAPQSIAARALIVVPHADDEINVAGAMIRNMTQNGTEVFCVFMTNGDFAGQEAGRRRMEEAVEALQCLGVRKENVLFLGYGDKWSSPVYRHIYLAPLQEQMTSHIGLTETYGGIIPDFHFAVSGAHSAYTRENLKKDLKDVCLQIKPDAFFAVDFDRHPDHRANSLLFDEIMGEILKENPAYAPNVYKGFAYATAWTAPKDFYEHNVKSSARPDPSQLTNARYETDTPNYLWEDRIRFPVPRSMLSYTIRSNLVYEAFSKHASQKARKETIRVANGDQVFWRRLTGGFSYESSVFVSSGEGRYLNDFKLIDSDDILNRHPALDQFVWVPDERDTEKTARIIFNQKRDVDAVILYDNPSLQDNITGGVLTFNNGTVLPVGPLRPSGAPTRIEVPRQTAVEWVSFSIRAWEGQRPGLCEMEVYDGARLTEPLSFIKLMVDGQFAYHYIVPARQKELALQVYAEGNDGRVVYQAMRGDIDKIIVQADGTVTLRPGFRSCVLRAALAGNPQIYDQIEIEDAGFFRRVWLSGLQLAEFLYNKVALR